jgi:hypothetical protein
MEEEDYDFRDIHFSPLSTPNGKFLNSKNEIQD